jgi:hypothetical protein
MALSSCSGRQFIDRQADTQIAFLRGDAAYAVFVAIQSEGYTATDMANYEIVVAPHPAGYRVGFSARREPSLVAQKGGASSGPELLISPSGQILERTLQE